MSHKEAIREHMKVIGADGVHVGTVDRIEDDRIKLSRSDSEDGRHHYLSLGLVAAVEGEAVRLSASTANAAELFEQD